MSFGKAFGLGILVFLVINLVFGLLTGIAVDINAGNAMDIIGSLIGNFTDMGKLGVGLFGAVLSAPILTIFNAVQSIGSLFSVSSLSFPLLWQSLGFLAAPLITALIAGKVGESKGAAFGATFLICLIGAVVIAVFNLMNLGAGVNSIVQGDILGYYSAFGIADIQLVLLIVLGAVNGLLWGGFALLLTGSDFY